MKMKMKMEIISNEIIKPSQKTPSNLVYLTPSVLDHVSAPVLMPLLFFYAKQHTYNTNTILNRLKNALPTTLSVFYPLAGRFQGANYIVCTDEGVPYVVAKVHSTCLSDIVHKAGVSVLDKLLPCNGTHQGYTDLLLAIQVTTFACGGISIGIRMSHAISDGFSFGMFVKKWTAIANGDTCTLSTNPCFDIWKEFPSNQSEKSMKSVLEEPNTDLIEIRPVMKWFMFSKANCEALRSKLGFEYDNSQNMPSLTMILSAFIWSRVTISRRSDVKSIPHEVFQAVNLRPKVKTPSESSYYFGNMVVNAIAVPNPHGNMSLCDSYLTAMDKSIEKIIGKSGVFIEELRNGKEDLGFMPESFAKLARGEIVSLGFSTMRSLPMYESDFGWGRPVWVTSAAIALKDMVIMIPGGGTGEDTYAYVNLSHDDMVKLENDHEFLSFASKSSNFVASKL